jgi:CheY-like chemotaxis protein
MTMLNDSTVLVVEDQPAIRKLVVEALGRAGYTVTEAKDGTEALQELAHRADALDLVLLDLSLPLVDGLEVLQQVRAQSPWLPVIAMSASREDLVDAKAAGARETLAKPFDISELLERVESCQPFTPQTTSATPS